MSNKRPEPHVAQQFRRDKLRIQIQDFPNNLEQLSLQPGFNPDLVQVRSVRNANMLLEQPFYSSEMLNFSTSSNPNFFEPSSSTSSRVMMSPQLPLVFPHSLDIHSSPELRNSGCDWMLNNDASTHSASAETNPNSIFIPDELAGLQSGPGEMHHNSLQDIMTSPMQQGHGIWVENQLVFLPNNVNQLPQNSLRCKKTSDQFLVSGTNNNQGLSLSLSSNNTQSAPCGLDEPQAPCVAFKDPQFSKSVNPSGDCGKSVVVGGYRGVGPLGPFTGYSAILKCSNFLEPAQELLDEICGQSIQKLTKICDVPGASTGGAVNASNSVFHTSNGNNNNNNNKNCVDGGAGSSCSSRPEYQQRMAKFLYMQEEVMRRYKQHHQQMQMVVSSFESVAGLSSATPYVSKALKSVSRHFKCLESAISDQLKRIRQVLAEELSGGSSKMESNMGRVRLMEQSFERNKFIMGSSSSTATAAGFNFEQQQQQQAWRPQQKGLPERAVAILRAWLFEHFLHPYPTDADKHMLAARTGLSRNQVSNWFINARVRVWKPMVEEIHMLETRGLKDENENESKKEGTCGIEIEGASECRADDQRIYNNTIQVQCSEIGSVETNVEEVEAQHWNQEKRSKVEYCEVASSMEEEEETATGFVPYRRSEVGGVGSVSLTLGLRHGVELGAQSHHHQLRRHFAGQIINHFNLLPN